jgi:hypothetical protein
MQKKYLIKVFGTPHVTQQVEAKSFCKAVMQRADQGELIGAFVSGTHLGFE